MLAKPNSEACRQKKWTRSVGALRPTDPAASRYFANLMTKVAPIIQSSCVSALSDDVSLITLILEVAKYLSLRALVDCGTSTILYVVNR